VLREITPPYEADAIVVFGAAVWPSGPSVALRVRTARAAALYAEGRAPLVLCSGGLSNGQSEAQAMRALLRAQGVPAAAILPDDGGVSTRATIRSIRGFGAGRWTRVIAVSSPYHMERIGREARRQGVDAILCAAARGGPRTWRLAVHDARQSLREWIARPAYAIGWHAGRLLEHGPGRLVRGAYRQVAGRYRYLTGEADAVAATSDAISGLIKARLARFSDTAPVFAPAAGLRWPVPGALGDRFGLRHRRLHAGVDVRAAYGVPVAAAADGVVLVAAHLGPYGNVVVLDHGGGVTTVCAHLAGGVADEGERLAAGALLGYVGTTGRSSGPHLHFEVRVHGSPVDPLAYLPPPA
jgi:hypothetical protein